MLFLVAVVAIGNGVVASQPKIPRWMPLLLPIVIAGASYLAWRHELHGEGDPQPGLVKAEGIGLVALSVMAILVGWLSRGANDRAR